MGSEVNFGLPPEIHGDAFHRTLFELAKRADLRTFLEIGSSSGEGSTQALVSVVRTRADRRDVKMFCMEISHTRFEDLKSNYAADGFVHYYHISSVPAASFASPEEIEHFHRVSGRYRFRRTRAAQKLAQML